jgi:outer membrane receptor protein involved in Fe transport
LGFVASGFLAPQKQDGITNSILKDDNSDITSLQKTIRTVDNRWKNGAANINFHTSADNGNKDLTANLDFLHYDFSGNQLIDGLSYTPNGIFESENNSKNTLPLTIDIYSARIDYSQPLGKNIKLETGLKTSLVKTNNTSDFFTLLNNQWITDSVNSNAFNYSENINAGYVNLNKTFGKWTTQAGLRLENTHYNGTQTALSQQSDSSFNRSYFSLFPSAFISYEANDNNRYGLSVSRRIDRPEYRDLNPFISYLDQYTYSTGNPYLQPQFSYNVELSHTYKNRFTTTLNYSVIHKMINETFSQFDSLIVRSVGNIGTRYNMGIAESARIPFTPWYTGIFYTNLYQNSYNGEINGATFKATQLTFAMNVNNQFSFTKGWAAELSGTFTSRNRDEGQAIVLPYGQVAAGLSKTLWHNKASLKCNVRDIFYTQNPKEIQNFQDVQSTIRITRDTRVFTLAFVYRFGTSNKSKSSASPTEEQKRVQLN